MRGNGRGHLHARGRQAIRPQPGRLHRQVAPDQAFARMAGIMKRQEQSDRRPRPAKGRFPYPHRTVAEADPVFRAIIAGRPSLAAFLSCCTAP